MFLDKMHKILASHDQVSFFPFIFLWDDVMSAGRLVTQIYEQRNGNTRHGDVEDREHMEG